MSARSRGWESDSARHTRAFAHAYARVRNKVENWGGGTALQPDGRGVPPTGRAGGKGEDGLPIRRRERVTYLQQQHARCAGADRTVNDHNHTPCTSGCPIDLGHGTNSARAAPAQAARPGAY